MKYIDNAWLNEDKFREANYLLSTVCKLTLTGTFEIPLKENQGYALEAENLSEEACFITGYTDQAMPARNYFQKVIPFEDQKKMQEAFDEAVRTNSVYNIKYRLRLRENIERILYQRGEVFFAGDNKEPVKMLCICCDITEYQKEYNMGDSPEDELIFIASHKLRAPLTNIIGISNILNDLSLELAGTEKIRELLWSIGEQAKHLDRAVHDLNELLSKTNKTQFTNKTLINVKELVLIDDEPLANKIHSRLIGSVNGEIQVTVFTDPAKGMNYLRENNSVGLLLLDINMPEMNAWDCLEFAKANNIDVNVIILSSSINPQDREKASEFNNVIGFLNKPLTKENIHWLLSQQ